MTTALFCSLAACTGPNQWVDRYAVGASAADDGTRAPGMPPSSRNTYDYESATNSYAPFLAMILPTYTLRIDPQVVAEDEEAAEHGFEIALPILIRDPQWRHGVVVSYTRFFRSDRETVKTGYRVRLFSSSQTPSMVHLLMGAGAFYDTTEGFGPRGELAWLFGRLGRGNAMIVTGYEFAPETGAHVALLSLGAFVPYLVQ